MGGEVRLIERKKLYGGVWRMCVMYVYIFERHHGKLLTMCCVRLYYIM